MCKIEISHMGKNNRNPDLVCKNSIIFPKLHKYSPFITLCLGSIPINRVTSEVPIKGGFYK